MTRWGSHIATVAAALVLGGSPALASDSGGAAVRESLLASLSAAVPSARCQARAVGRAVALRAVMQPLAITDEQSLRRVAIAAVHASPRRL